MPETTAREQEVVSDPVSPEALSGDEINELRGRLKLEQLNVKLAREEREKYRRVCDNLEQSNKAGTEYWQQRFQQRVSGLEMELVDEKERYYRIWAWYCQLPVRVKDKYPLEIPGLIKVRSKPVGVVGKLIRRIRRIGRHLLIRMS